MPKVTTGTIDSIAGVTFQLLITAFLFVILGLIGQYKATPDMAQSLENTIPKQIIKQLFPIARKLLISPENQYLVESEDDGKGLMVAIGVEQKFLESLSNGEAPPSTGDKIRDLINTPIPFRGGYYRLKDPKLIKVAEQYIRDMIKKRQMQQESN